MKNVRIRPPRPAFRRPFALLALAFAALAACAPATAPVEEATVERATDSVIVSYVSGDVVLTRGGEEYDTFIGQRLETTDILSTALDALCEIVVGDVARVTIDEDTIFRVETLTLGGSQRSAILGVDRGSIFCRVESLVHQTVFGVRTATAVLGVRGTQFLVQANTQGETTVAVTEGNVAVLPPSVDMGRLNDTFGAESANWDQTIGALLDAAPSVSANEEIAVTAELAAQTVDQVEALALAVTAVEAGTVDQASGLENVRTAIDSISQRSVDTVTPAAPISEITRSFLQTIEEKMAPIPEPSPELLGQAAGSAATPAGTVSETGALPGSGEATSAVLPIEGGSPGLPQPSGEFSNVPGGVFLMGDRAAQNNPNRPVRITRPYLMSRTEVTWAQFADVLNWAVDKGYTTSQGTTLLSASNGRTIFDASRLPASPQREIDLVGGRLVVTPGREAYPSRFSTIAAAVAYCNWRSEREDLLPCYNPNTYACDLDANGYRLPTSAEWEWAARGGREEAPPFAGGDRAEDVAWFAANSNRETQAVGRKRPNQLNLFDMTGNVWELVNDLAATRLEPSMTGDNPLGPVAGDRRLVRGGAFTTARPEDLRLTIAAQPLGQAEARPDVGFRVVRSAVRAVSVERPAMTPEPVRRLPVGVWVVQEGGATPVDRFVITPNSVDVYLREEAERLPVFAARTTIVPAGLTLGRITGTVARNPRDAFPGVEAGGTIRFAYEFREALLVLTMLRQDGMPDENLSFICREGPPEAPSEGAASAVIRPTPGNATPGTGSAARGNIVQPQGTGIVQPQPQGQAPRPSGDQGTTVRPLQDSGGASVQPGAQNQPGRTQERTGAVTPIAPVQGNLPTNRGGVQELIIPRGNWVVQNAPASWPDSQYVFTEGNLEAFMNREPNMTVKWTARINVEPQPGGSGRVTGTVSVLRGDQPGVARVGDTLRFLYQIDGENMTLTFALPSWEPMPNATLTLRLRTDAGVSRPGVQPGVQPLNQQPIQPNVQPLNQQQQIQPNPQQTSQGINPAGSGVRGQSVSPNQSGTPDERGLVAGIWNVQNAPGGRQDSRYALTQERMDVFYGREPNMAQRWTANISIEPLDRAGNGHITGRISNVQGTPSADLVVGSELRYIYAIRNNDTMTLTQATSQWTEVPGTALVLNRTQGQNQVGVVQPGIQPAVQPLNPQQTGRPGIQPLNPQQSVQPGIQSGIQPSAQPGIQPNNQGAPNPIAVIAGAWNVQREPAGWQNTRYMLTANTLEVLGGREPNLTVQWAADLRVMPSDEQNGHIIATVRTVQGSAPPGIVARAEIRFLYTVRGDTLTLNQATADWSQLPNTTITLNRTAVQPVANQPGSTAGSAARGQPAR